MKNLFKNLMLVAVAAMGFTACEQVIDDVNATNETFTVTIVGEFADDTRSGFDGKNDAGTGYKSAWDGNETAVFSLDEAALVDATNTYTDGGNKALFAPEITTTGTTIYAFSPKGVYNSSDASKCKGGVTGIKANEDYAYVVVPAVQTPLANSVDPDAHILAGKADFAENVNMTFNHVVAYGKMTIKNFAGDIDKVEVTASESLAGISCKYFYNEGNLDNANVKTITLNADKVEGNVFWFGCAPADLTTGTLTVKVYSGEDTYTKELAISGKNFKFQQGHVASFGVDMADATKDEIVEDDEIVVDWVDNAYNLVKSAAHLEVGDKVVIVAAGFECAMSTTFNTNNVVSATITKNINNTITFDNKVLILTLEAGTVDNTYAFKTTDGRYLYAASSSSNQLKTQTTLNENGSWAIEIAADGVATIKAQGKNTRNLMRFNNSNTPKIFSCYGSGQDDICIYKLVGEYTPTVPAISYTVADVDVEYDAAIGEAAVVATNGDGWDLSATVDADADWVSELVCTLSKISFKVGHNDTGASREATVTVTATKAGYDDVTTKFTITQGAKPVGGAKTYTFTITKEDFNTKSYDANNNEKTSTATASDGTTIEVKWTSNQVMQQSSTMQWQKNKGYIFNSTDLGTINSVEIDDTAGTFTTYINSSKQPTTNGTGGYFQIKVGGATGKVDSIKVTFTK